MKKLLFNVVGILILSICVLSCSKDKDEIVPITKDGIVGQWSISETPVIKVNISGVDESQRKKISDTLDYLFRKGDKYLFKEGSSCEVTRNRTVEHPNTYAINGGYLIFDGYIKFQTNVSGDKLTLTAGDAEIRGIVKKELIEMGGFEDETKLNVALSLVTGEVKLVFIKVKE